jgi:L-threonylcarbamoyladenylate synthase
VPAPRQTKRLQATEAADIARAVEILRFGGLVAFPTETVYGLGANALSPTAVQQIFVAKQRPHWDPLIVHIADRTQLPQITTSFSPLAQILMDAFWPGPLTLLLPRTAAIPDSVTAGRPLVGVRIPAHPVAQALLRATGLPIAAPSANTFGHTSPTTAQHVLDDLDTRIDAVLDGGPTTVGLESTVVEVLNDEIIIYRPGGITMGQIESVVGSHIWVHIHTPEPAAASPASLPSPGVGIRHYAPRARLILIDGFREEEIVRSRKLLELQLVEPIDEQVANGETVGVMLPDEWDRSCADHIFRCGPWHEPKILAQRLYDGLRALDDAGCTVILCPVPTSPGITEAIRDRLQKAARPARKQSS